MSGVTALAAARGTQLDQKYVALLERMKKALETVREINIPVNNIRPYLKQPRDYFDPDGLRKLSVSIRLGGQANPGLMRANRGDAYAAIDTGTEIERRRVPGTSDYELIDGERRWRSIWLIPSIERPHYKARLIEADDEVVQFIISIMMNTNREGHNPQEMMHGIKRNVDAGIPMKIVAELMGISEGWAKAIYGLRLLIPEVFAMLDPKLPKKQRLLLTAAIQIAGEAAENQLVLARRVMSQDIRLPRLRGAIVKLRRQGTKDEAANPVEVREVAVSHQLASIKNSCRVGMESLELFRDQITDRDKRVVVGKLLGNDHDVRTLLFQLNEAKKFVAECINHIDKIGSPGKRLRAPRYESTEALPVLLGSAKVDKKVIHRATRL